MKCAVKGGSKVGTNQNGTLIEEEEEQGREQLHTNEREREKESDDRSSPFPLSLSLSLSFTFSNALTLSLFIPSRLEMFVPLCQAISVCVFVSPLSLLIYLFIYVRGYLSFSLFISKTPTTSIML